MQFLIFAFALIFVALGQETPTPTPTPELTPTPTPELTPTPTPEETPTPTPTPAAELTVAEVIAALEALLVDNLNEALTTATVSNVTNITGFNSTSGFASYQSATFPPSPNFTVWAETLQNVLCLYLNFTTEQCVARVVSREDTNATLNATFVVFTFLDPVVVVPSPTPTPVVDTPTPTPVVDTPTPTPVTTPTPSPQPACDAPCVATFEATRSENNYANAGFTVQCGAWQTLLSCLRECGDQVAAPQEETCLSTPYVQDLCSCNQAGPVFDGPKRVQVVRAYRDVIVGLLIVLPGVQSTVDNINFPRDDQFTENSFRFALVWDDAAPIDNNNPEEVVTREYLVQRIKEIFSAFLFTNQGDIQVNVVEGKRATQTTTFEVVFVQTSVPNGVSTLVMSLGFVMASLLHVLF